MTSETNDLERLLGYGGAVDDRTGLTEEGPDLYRVPFWTPGFCAVVIRAAEATGAFAADPDDPVPGREVSLALVSPVLFEAVQNDVGHRIWPQLQSVWPLIEYRGLRDAFVIKYAPGEQESLRLHQDVAQVSGTVRLNDGYVGAAVHFPRQGYRNDEQPVGELLAWPSLVTHPHEALPLESGVKYGLTIWCELPADVAAY